MAKPKIRFKGYTDDWEQRKLGESASSFEYGLNAAAKEYDGENKYIRITDIDDNTHEFLTYNLTSPDIDLTDAENYKLAEGDILFARTGASVGKSYIYRDSDGLVYYAGFLIRARIREEYDAEFVFQSTLTDKYNKYIAVTSQRSGQPGVNAQEYSEFEIRVPEKEEQTKIGTYFRNLDHLITLHQRKCEETKKLKKYMLQKMFPQNGQTVPEIRFAGFTDAWEQRKLGDILVSLQNNTLSRADLSNEAGVAKNVHYGDVLIKFGEVLDVSKEQLPMISDESILTKYKTSFLQNGDVIIADTAEDTTVGKCSEIVGLNDEVVLSGLHTIPYRPVEKFAPKYLGYYLNSDAYHNQLLPLMQGIKVTSISKSAMQDTDIIYPKSKEEQTEIGNYFDVLDHLITLHQCKCHLLLKLLYNDWEQRKLDDVAEFSKGSGYSKGDLIGAGTPIILYGRLYTKYETIISDVDTFVEAKDGSVYSKGGEVIVPASGETAEDIARAASVDKSGILLGGDLNVMMPNEDINSAFLAISISNGSSQRELARKAQGKSVVHIHNEEIRNLIVAFPTKAEQNKIENYFADLDHLITLHHRKYTNTLKAP